MKERKVEMRAKSTQSDSYLILQPEKKVQESDSVLQVSILRNLPEMQLSVFWKFKILLN